MGEKGKIIAYTQIRKKTYFSKLKRKDKGLKDNLTHIEFAPTKEITGKKLRLKRQLCTCRVAPTKEITGKNTID